MPPFWCHRASRRSNHREQRTAKAKAFDTEAAEGAPRFAEYYGTALTFLNNGTALTSLNKKKWFPVVLGALGASIGGLGVKRFYMCLCSLCSL
jgi:hypothetical protein